jgi:hypothetical protein
MVVRRQHKACYQKKENGALAAGGFSEVSLFRLSTPLELAAFQTAAYFPHIKETYPNSCLIPP